VSQPIPGGHRPGSAYPAAPGIVGMRAAARERLDSRSTRLHGNLSTPAVNSPSMAARSRSAAARPSSRRFMSTVVKFLHSKAAMIEDGPWIFPELNAAGWKYN
jgi:hypothetical protein